MTTWCPQHGYPEPCAKCNGMTPAEWKSFFKSLAEAVGAENDGNEPLTQEARLEIIKSNLTKS